MTGKEIDMAYPRELGWVGPADPEVLYGRAAASETDAETAPRHNGSRIKIVQNGSSTPVRVAITNTFQTDRDHPQVHPWLPENPEGITENIQLGQE